jgi:hypothetical protein
MKRRDLMASAVAAAGALAAPRIVDVAYVPTRFFTIYQARRTALSGIVRAPFPEF